ncbi:MAG: hypothetical protein E7Z67_02560 [Thermoplasmata archaeon]|nr:hypothetical protein [Thermoplasmata archaeon]
MRFNLSRFDFEPKCDLSRYQVTSFPVQYRRKYSFSPTIAVTPTYRRLIMDIKEMDRLLDDIHLNTDDYVLAMKDSYASNIRTALVRDGSDVTSDDVIDFLDTYNALDGKVIDSVGGPKQEIYNNMHAFAYGIGRSEDWDAEMIVELHRMLMDGVDERVIPGEIRSEKHVVLDENGGVVRVACPPEYIRTELDSLMDWLKSSPYDPVSTGMMFVSEFSSINPFEYGSNRVTHTMFQIVLHDLGLRNIGLCRYDDLIDADRETYDRLLNYARAESDYFPVSMYVAMRIHESYRLALRDLGSKDRLDGGDGYMCLIARCARQIDDEFTVAEACSWAPDVREQTIRTKLNALVDLGILDRKGNTRNTRYRYKDFLKHLRGGYNLF